MKKFLSRTLLALSSCTVLLVPGHAEGLPPSIALLKNVTLVGHAQSVYRAPDGPKGWYSFGFRGGNDSALDLSRYAGILIHLDQETPAAAQLVVSIRTPRSNARQDFVAETHATVAVSGVGPHSIALPWSAFDFRQAQPAFLRFVKEIRVESGGSGRALLTDVGVVRGFPISLDTEITGKSAEPGGAVEYVAQVANCSDKPQAVSLTFERRGWEAMRPHVEPAMLELPAGGSANVRIHIALSSRIPPGGREKQLLKAIPNGDAASGSSLEFVTAAALPHPYVLHTPQRWQEVRDKIAKYPWAKDLEAAIVAQAERWVVPEVAKVPSNLTGVDNMGPYLFPTPVENDLMATGEAYQLTRDKRFAEKIRTFMLRLSSPVDGYPVTLRGCNQSSVQEGHFFQHVAMTYDAALDSGVFTKADQAQIERTLRLFIESMRLLADAGAINNWNLSQDCGALYCALAIQDMALADRFFWGPSGVVDQLANGCLDDGWWYECATSYNVWCTSEFSQIALAMEPWGVNFRDMRVPAGHVPQFSLAPWAMEPGLYGMSFEKWGPITSPTVDIKRMWDALPRFADYRGMMFGVNDASENRLSGVRREVGAQPFELAYYLYRDPAYATVIRQGGGSRDLLYGVPELPDETGKEAFRNSAYADNVGLAMLRSQTPDRPQREQIQAVLHYGTHGAFHGHFDRTELLHLSRHGRSFYNPEIVWYGYESFMYKFYLQNSTSKNMVVVDRKMQEPVESQRLLWHTGKLFQATAVQTKARWSTPPYGGMVYPEQGYKTLQEKSFGEGRYLPKPPKEPAYGSLGDFTEPVLQRRLMIVTDDYVLLADYLKGEREHTFENLLQMKGFQGLEGADKQFVRHDPQWDSNPILDAQFVTDCDWYQATAPAKARFEMRFGPDADNEGTLAPNSEPGVLKLDVHTLWPQKQELMVGAVPENHNVQKRLFWDVKGDGKILAEGKFGAWILGSGEVDVPLAGIKNLRLETRVEISRKPSVFWGNARIVTPLGKEIPLTHLPIKYENVLSPAKPGRDYFGGPIKIVGTLYAVATPGQPQDDSSPGIIELNLSGLGAVRLKATIGSDYPLGDESQRRKTYASKVVGKDARFLTVIEPYEDQNVVLSAVARDADHIEVRLKDGRTQLIELRELTGAGNSIAVTVTESKDGRVTRSETSK